MGRSWPLLLAVLGACSRPSGPLTGPPAHPWASFPAGTWAEFSWSLGGKQFTERWEIVEVTPAAVRLRVTEKDRPPREETIATVEEPFAERGTEPIRLGERVFRCRRLERGGERRWVSDDLPAWPVREETAEGRTLLVSINETVGGRRCMLFETIAPDGARVRRWKSLEVPGHAVLEVRQTELGEARQELVAWGP